MIARELSLTLRGQYVVNSELSNISLQQRRLNTPKYSNTLPAGEHVFVGLDLHNLRWHVTIRTSDVELSSAAIPGRLGSAAPSA